MGDAVNARRAIRMDRMPIRMRAVCDDRENHVTRTAVRGMEKDSAALDQLHHPTAIVVAAPHP